MTVGEVVNHLPGGPATLAIGRVETLRRQLRQGLLDVPWQCVELANPSAPLVGGDILVEHELSDRVAKVHAAIIR